MAGTHIDRAIIGWAIAGILVSTYALYVEMAAEANPGYKALCDIGAHASCSRVLTSEYSKGFGLLPKDTTLAVPNCVYGIIYFCMIIFMTTFSHTTVVRLQFGLSLAAVVSCIYLAYLLIFVLHDFCVVCVSMYVVNVALSILSYKKLNLLAIKKKYM